MVEIAALDSVHLRARAVDGGDRDVFRVVRRVDQPGAFERRDYPTDGAGSLDAPDTKERVFAVAREEVVDTGPRFVGGTLRLEHLQLQVRVLLHERDYHLLDAGEPRDVERLGREAPRGDDQTTLFGPVGAAQLLQPSNQGLRRQTAGLHVVHGDVGLGRLGDDEVVRHHGDAPLVGLLEEVDHRLPAPRGVEESLDAAVELRLKRVDLLGLIAGRQDLEIDVRAFFFAQALRFQLLPVLHGVEEDVVRAPADGGDPDRLAAPTALPALLTATPARGQPRGAGEPDGPEPHVPEHPAAGHYGLHVVVQPVSSPFSRSRLPKPGLVPSTPLLNLTLSR